LSELTKAIIGILTYDASVIAWWSATGSVMITRRGSLNARWIWLVNEPGVKRPAIGVAPISGLETHFNNFNFQVAKKSSEI